MKIGALFGWGIAIYSVMFLLWSAFVTYGFVDGMAPRIISLLVLIGIAILAGQSLHFHAWLDVLPYSIFWVVIMAILDGILGVPYSGFALYMDPNLWFGYAIVLLVPLIAHRFYINHSHSDHASASSL